MIFSKKDEKTMTSNDFDVTTSEYKRPTQEQSDTEQFDTSEYTKVLDKLVEAANKVLLQTKSPEDVFVLDKIDAVVKYIKVYILRENDDTVQLTNLTKTSIFNKSKISVRQKETLDKLTKNQDKFESYVVLHDALILLEKFLDEHNRINNMSGKISLD